MAYAANIDLLAFTRGSAAGNGNIQGLTGILTIDVSAFTTGGADRWFSRTYHIGVRGVSNLGFEPTIAQMGSGDSAGGATLTVQKKSGGTAAAVTIEAAFSGMGTLAASSISWSFEGLSNTTIAANATQVTIP
jgi:hypothetical protein